MSYRKHRVISRVQARLLLECTSLPQHTCAVVLSKVQKDSQLSDYNKILLLSLLWSSTTVHYFPSARLVTLTLITLPNVASASGSFFSHYQLTFL